MSENDRKGIDAGATIQEAGRRVRALREIMELEPYEMAERFGIGTGFLMMVEDGKIQPSRLLLKIIADTLNVERDWLLYGQGPSPKKPEAETLPVRYELPILDQFSERCCDVGYNDMSRYYDIPYNDDNDKTCELMAHMRRMGVPEKMMDELFSEYNYDIAKAQEAFYRFGIKEAVAFLMQALETGANPLYSGEAAKLLADRISESANGAIRKGAEDNERKR